MRLREYIAQLEAKGELLRISTKVDPRYEICEITDRVSKSEGGGKALLFENTGTDYPVLMNMMGSDRRMAMAIGVEQLEDITKRIDDLLKGAMSPKSSLWEKLQMLPLLKDVAKWFPKRIKGRGECQEVVLRGEDVDLSKLPILTSWPYDGGAFITLPMVATVDPESGTPNLGMYRMQVFDKCTTGMHWHRHKTGARHYDAYKRLGIKRMPVSVALGGDPAYIYSATAPMPDNMDEMLLAGMLRQRPVRLTKCITNDLWVPADCDFVLEGYVDTTEPLTVEGPFGDHTGFYSLTDLYPRFHIEAITTRRDAVYPATIVGVPPMEDAYIAKATERIFLAPIRLAVQPEVRDLYMPIEGTAHNIALVSIVKRYLGQANKVAQGLWGAGQMMFNKYMVIAPENCDIRSTEAVMERLSRVDADKHLIWSEGILDVLDHATPTTGYGSKLAIDLTDIDITEARKPFSVPRTAQPMGGVEFFNTEFAQRWGVLILYAEREWREKIDVEEYITRNGFTDMRYVVLFDRGAVGSMNNADLLWLAAANTDPKRDIRIFNGTIIIDARSKRPGYGNNPSRFPNAVTSLPETIHYVDERWAEYGIGEFIESPSKRYRKLWLSDSAQW
ncbi:MAG: menaquinone biosynthesis decarboxylase [Alistipes sp.]|nr:menaquinone biosynthesis decarboxylase [Alistipes sp.]